MNIEQAGTVAYKNCLIKPLLDVVEFSRCSVIALEMPVMKSKITANNMAQSVSVFKALNDGCLLYTSPSPRD